MEGLAGWIWLAVLLGLLGLALHRLLGEPEPPDPEEEAALQREAAIEALQRVAGAPAWTTPWCWVQQERTPLGGSRTIHHPHDWQEHPTRTRYCARCGAVLN